MTTLKSLIVEQYSESYSTVTMVSLVVIFLGLAFTFFKVNKMVNKAHLF